MIKDVAEAEDTIKDLLERIKELEEENRLVFEEKRSTEEVRGG